MELKLQIASVLHAQCMLMPSKLTADATEAYAGLHPQNSQTREHASRLGLVT